MNGKITTILVGNTPGNANGGITVYSLEEALNLCAEIRARGENQPLTVKIFSGVYELENTLKITPEISDVRIETFSGKADVIISGAKKVKGEKCVFCGINCLVFDNPDKVSDFYTKGGRAIPTRFPESGYFKFLSAENNGIMLDDVSKWVIVDKSDFKDLSAEEIENSTLNFLHYWVDEHTDIESFDEKTGKLVMKNYSRFGIYGEKTESVYYLTNVKKTFGARGRFYSDNVSGKVYYVPKDDLDTDLFIPHIDYLVEIAGAPDNKVKNVSFKNINFAYTRGDREIFREDGLSVSSDGQAACGARGVVNLSYAENCAFSGCKFTHYGLYGLNVEKGCAYIAVKNSEFFGGGAGGVKVSGADFFGNEKDRTHSAEITECEIKDCGNRYMSACGILVGHAYNNKITHNEIHDLYYSGISVGWVWGYTESITKNNYIAYNKIYSLGKGVLSDMGGVYLLGAQKGTQVFNNLIFDIKAREYGGWGVYTDEGSAHITIENNVCYDCSENCFHQHYGKENTVKNNIFARAGKELCRITRGENHLSAVFCNNVYFAESSAVYGLLSKMHLESGRVESRNNIVCAKNVDDITFIFCEDEKLSFPAAQKLGFDKDSVILSAKVVFGNNGEIRVPNDVYSTAFRPIEFKNIGKKKRNGI